jgi:hypothetical protein
MSSDKVLLSKAVLRYQLQEALKDLCCAAEEIRLLGVTLTNGASEFLPEARPEGVRQFAVVAKAQALGVLIGVTTVAAGAERLAAIADVCEAADRDDESDG